MHSYERNGWPRYNDISLNLDGQELLSLTQPRISLPKLLQRSVDFVIVAGLSAFDAFPRDWILEASRLGSNSVGLKAKANGRAKLTLYLQVVGPFLGGGFMGRVLSLQARRNFLSVAPSQATITLGIWMRCWLSRAMRRMTFMSDTPIESRLHLMSCCP
jgi:hypothetical protein